MLYKRLESQVFAEMQNAESTLFEPALVSLLGNNKKRRGGASYLVSETINESQARAMAKALTLPG